MNRALWNTQNDLAEKVRRDAITLLNQQLADALDVALQAKQAQWNVKGPNFIALHELFDAVVAEMFEHADDLAERAVQLGGTAFGTARTSAHTSRVPEYPLDIDSGRGHVIALSGVPAMFGASARAGIDAENALGDADTADLFTEISRGRDPARTSTTRRHGYSTASEPRDVRWPLLRRLPYRAGRAPSGRDGASEEGRV